MAMQASVCSGSVWTLYAVPASVSWWASRLVEENSARAMRNVCGLAKINTVANVNINSATAVAHGLGTGKADASNSEHTVATSAPLVPFTRKASEAPIVRSPPMSAPTGISTAPRSSDTVPGLISQTALAAAMTAARAQ